MSYRIDETNEQNELSHPPAVQPAMANDSRMIPARASSPLRRDAHYDWMDFHSLPELSREW